MTWYVAVGSALGGVCRYLLGAWAQRVWPGAFPYGTLLINVLGSLLLGFLLRAMVNEPSIGPHFRALLTVGFCGGFTTFSTFSYETAVLLEQGDHRRAFGYVALSIVLAVGGVFAGFVLARETAALRIPRL